jgi:hypothetical protein
VLRIIRKYYLDRPRTDGSAAPTEASDQRLGWAACPLCHTDISSASARSPWQCRRCGQRWSPRRLATVAVYATWVSARAERDGAVLPDEAEVLQPLPVAV